MRQEKFSAEKPENLLFNTGVLPKEFEELLNKGETTTEVDLFPQNFPTNVGDYIMVGSTAGGQKKRCLIMSISLTDDEQKTLVRYRLKEKR